LDAVAIRLRPLILSTCYEGEFKPERGRVKIPTASNQEGRIDFCRIEIPARVAPFLNGEIRKLLTMKGYQSLRRDWRSAERSFWKFFPAN